MLLPLRDLFEVPPRHFRLVVDNARSPEHPVSFQKRRRRRQMLTRRSLSMDDSSPSNRWSSISIVPLIPHVNEDRDDKPLVSHRQTTGGHRRACSLDGFGQTVDNSSSPLRIPRRHQSPPSSPSTDHERQIITSFSSLRIPIRRPSPHAVPKKAIEPDKVAAMKELYHKPGSSLKGNAKPLLCFPAFELRQDSIHEERSSEGKYSPLSDHDPAAGDPTRRLSSATTEYISKALETVKVVD